MVNPGTFRGTRKVFLLGQLPAYAKAVEGGYALDGIALISRRYFKRYPVNLPLDEEPTPEHLAGVDDEEIEPDEPPIDPTQLSLEDFIEEELRREERAVLIVYRQAVSLSFAVFDSNGVAHLPQADQTLAFLSLYEGPKPRPS